MPIDYPRLAEQALRGEAPDRSECAALLDSPDVELLRLLDAAYQPRRHHFGRKVMVHVLNNVQNGLCPEDCGYCSQNRDSKAAIRPYPMKSEEEIFAEAEAAARSGASRYCMVLSGRGPNAAYVERLAKAIAEVKRRYPIEVCVSAGLIDDEKARVLADAGLDRLNHNLNTSARHYPEICSTHSYADRVATLEAARRNGIETCSGLIMGMGEQTEDLVDVAFELRELEVPSIPVNFLIPIDGNQVVEDGSLTPGALPSGPLRDATGEPVRGAPGRRRPRGQPPVAAAARPLPGELTVRRGLPDDPRGRDAGDLPHDPRGGLRGGGQPAL